MSFRGAAPSLRVPSRPLKLAVVVPGGVDRSGEYRVIPALLALLERLAHDNEVHVFALAQEPEPGEWDLAGARVHNIGSGSTIARAVAAIDGAEIVAERGPSQAADHVVDRGITLRGADLADVGGVGARLRYRF